VAALLILGMKAHHIGQALHVIKPLISS